MSEFHTVMMPISEVPQFLVHNTETRHWYWSPNSDNARRFATREQAREALKFVQLQAGDRVTIQRFVTKYAGHVCITVGV